MKQLREANLERQLTNQGLGTIKIQFRCKLTGEYLHTRQIMRATLAKLYHDQKITHALNGVPVVDI